jgi:hypothetical protein
MGTPTPRAARQQLEDAEFQFSRLATLRPRLARRLATVTKQAEHEAWLQDYEIKRKTRDGLAAELKEIYSTCAPRIADVFKRCADFAGELHQLHSRRPAGEPLPLDPPELVARNLEAFDRDKVSLLGADGVRLLDWARSQQIWPPKSPPSVLYAPIDLRKHPDEFSSSWQRAIAAEQERKQWLQQQEEHARLQRDKDKPYYDQR